MRDHGLRAIMLRACGLAACAAVAACSSSGERSSYRSGLEDIGSTGPGGFVRSSDTYGTGRRVDVYGGSNAPVLPTIGAVGFGK